MLDDFAPNGRRKPKIISPLQKLAAAPLPSLDSFAPSADPLTDPAVPTFHTPEEVAAESTDHSLENAEKKLARHALAATTAGDKQHWHHYISKRWPLSKKKTIIYGVVVAVLLIACAASYFITRSTAVQGGQHTVKATYTPPAPTTVASALSGLQVEPAVNQRPVTGVMIENSPDARPQSGIDQASVVFEAIAEGGITRFLTLYQDTQPDYLGPVRSARPYYVQWCMSFDCSLAHAGGSPEALQNIKTWGTKDLDQFANSGAYERISSRYAPHNLYTSTAQLSQLESTKGFGASTYTGFSRKKEAASKTPNASSIDFAISGFYYNAHFDYDATSNSYLRSQAGAPHMALNRDGSQVQIAPKVVVAMVMQYGVAADHHSQYNSVGTGQAFVFQDGVATPATWTKSDIKAPLVLTGADGKPLALNPGKTWITAVSGADKVAYK